MKSANTYGSGHRRCGLALVLGWIVMGPGGGLAVAESTGQSLPGQVREAQRLSLVLGKSTVVDIPVAIKRASLADPQIADAIVLSPRQIYVTGKGYGTTNLTLWGKDDQILAVFDLDVGIDLVRLKQHLRELLPDETNILVRGTHDHVAVSGTVSSDGCLRQVLAVAEAYAPKKVLNFLRVYPEPAATAVPTDSQPVTVEVIKGTAVNTVKF